MYEEYFGLKRPPFRITPDTSLFYEGGRRGDILAALAYAVQRGEGIIKVVGEVGSGKTMLCRMLQHTLPEQVEIIYIANPSVAPEDILFVIASELHFDVDRGASKHELVSRLQDYLLQRHAQDRQVVLFIEEAQGMPLETLEEIRLLSNLETDQHKLLQIILFGQPELDENLSKKSIRQLRERITHEFKLAPLDADEIHRYLNFRMREVGYTGPELINRKLARKLADHSQGLLRRVNILADKMLLAAYADDTHTLTAKHLKQAVEDSGFPRRGIDGARHRLLYGLLLGLVLLLALLFIYGLWPRWSGMPGIGGHAEPSPASAAAAQSPRATTLRNATAVAAGRRDADPGLPASTDMSVAQPPSANPAPAEEAAAGHSPDEMSPGSKKMALTGDKLDKVNVDRPVAAMTAGEIAAAPGQTVASLPVPEQRAAKVTVSDPPAQQWLQRKLEQSRSWLQGADGRKVAIQVMVRDQAAAGELVRYLRRQWPLDLEKTRLFEVSRPNGKIYRVFYGEYANIAAGQRAINELPEEIQGNRPYLHSIHRMQRQLL